MTDYKVPTQTQIADYLKGAKTIAVVGLSSNPDKTSYQVAKVMQDAGYQIIPVNPVAAGKDILGEKVYASLTDVPQHMDIVDVFRPSDFLPDIAKEFVQTDADIFWAQLGLFSEEAATILHENHKDKVVMDRCIKIEYNNL
ncbi:MAG: CoA-binding protein [Vagococcus sp.]